MAAEFTIVRRVQFAETDMAGIAHFSNYFRMMEEAEHAFFRSLGLSVDMRHGDVRIGWPRVATSCDYAGAARFEDELTLVLRVTRVGEKSLTYEVDFNLGERRIAVGKTTAVCCVIEPGEAMRSIAIPDDIRSKLDSASPG